MSENRFDEQAKTLSEAKRLLSKYKKCMVIRPTGFGKTWLLTELIKDYKSVLYLYPSAVIRDTVVDRYYEIQSEDEDVLDPETVESYKAIGEIENCTLMTYAKLIRLSDDEIRAARYDLVICDEAHRMGAPKTKVASEKLFAWMPKKTHFIGATATPTRMDNFDVVSHFFADRMVYTYTLFDAIQDGMLKKPVYCYATYNFRKDITDAAKADGQDVRDPAVERMIQAKEIELSTLFNMPRIISDICGKYAVSTDYMKFIVFFASKAHMNTKLDDVVGWFREAYPGHRINTLKISSVDKSESKNTGMLPLLESRPGTIDLIACIDMLNVGYHVDNQTGIIMYRGTKSNTIFTQQFGRALSAGAGNSAIVFDIVDNLHQKAVYELCVKDTSNRVRNIKKYAQKDDYVLDGNTGRIMLDAGGGDLVETQYALDEGGRIVDRNGNGTTFKYDAKSGRVMNSAVTDSAEKNINTVTAECLEATGHEATYREIIAKAMAEPMSHRCKYALQLHFQSWCRVNGVPYPISKRELTDMYGLEMTDFYDEFAKIIKKNKIKYPLQDAEALMAIGKDDPIEVPMSVCCEVTGISVQQMTDLIFSRGRADSGADGIGEDI